MPRILPAGGEVDWPRNEGVLGVVGVAPWATIDFLRAFYALVPATKDWHFPRVLSDINTKLPSRGRYFQLGERDPSPFIAETIAELKAMGATAAVVPCNTAHLLFDRWAAGAEIPIPHIVEETVALATEQDARTACAFTSGSLAQFDLYGSILERRGVDCYRLATEDQSTVTRLLEEVKATGGFTQAGLAECDRLCKKLRSAGVDTILLGCTELSGLMPRLREHGLRAIDSNHALARKALDLVSAASHKIPA